METQIYTYQRLSSLSANLTHINQDLCFADVSAFFIRRPVKVRYACLQTCVYVLPAGENIWRHSLHFLTQTGSVKASGRLGEV